MGELTINEKRKIIRREFKQFNQENGFRFVRPNTLLRERNNILQYVQPLNFIREIDGTVYAVRAFFSENARENITEKVQRIILKSDDNNKEI